MQARAEESKRCLQAVCIHQPVGELLNAELSYREGAGQGGDSICKVHQGRSAIKGESTQAGRAVAYSVIIHGRLLYSRTPSLHAPLPVYSVANSKLKRGRATAGLEPLNNKHGHSLAVRVTYSCCS